MRHGRVGVVIDRRRARDRGILSDEDIECTGTDQVDQTAAGGVATVYAKFVEALIDQPDIVGEVADETVVLEAEIAVEASDITPGVLIKERAARAEVVN